MQDGMHVNGGKPHLLGNKGNIIFHTQITIVYLCFVYFFRRKMKESKRIFPLVAKTILGLEEPLRKELEKLGGEKLQILNRAVSFEGNDELIYRANYCCRTALRILKPIHTFALKKQDDLYDAVKEIQWEILIGTGMTMAVDAVIHDSVFTNSQYVALKTKDAVVDRLRNLRGTRPSIDLDHPDLQVHVHINKETCTVSLDSSGPSLHKRGYRQSTGAAPLNEVLAAGMVNLSGWDKKSPFIDPMCGSGTLLIEAAMLAQNIPAGYFRKEFGFQSWNTFDPELWHAVIASENEKITHQALSIKGSDIAPRVIRAAGDNIRFAGLQDVIKVETCPFSESVPYDGNGIVLMNPPYDERMRLDDIIAFYKSIGDVLKKKYTGYNAWVISSDLNALKFIGLHPSKKITLFNGPLECRLVRFSLY
jgi:putative N6-adenine-specific DNA methylase